MKGVFLLFLTCGIAMLVTGQDNEECPWKWKLRVKLWGINDNNIKRIRNTNEEDCKLACEQETDFECVSIDFNFVFKYCYLQVVGRADANEDEWASWPRYIYNERARTCPGCKTFWDVQGIQGYAIDGLDDRVVEDISESACLQECEDNTLFTCWSVDYNPTERLCNLNPVRRDDVPGRFREAPGFSFSERIERCPNCKLEWTSDVIGYELEGNDEEVIEAETAEDCKTACVNATDFNCMSVDYNKGSKSCALSSVTNADAPADYHFTGRHKTTYYERSWVCPGCEWKWGWDIRNEAISDNNPIKLYGVTEHECMTACETTTDFLCKSVDWKWSTNKCFVTKVSRDDAPEHWTSWPPYIYHQRQLRCDCDVEWTSEMVSGYGREDGREEKSTQVDSFDECKDLCDNESEFDCRAAGFADGICRLYSNNKENSPGTYEQQEGSLYAEKDTVCPGCSWEFRRTLKHKSVPTEKTMENLTLKYCKAECKNNLEFFCKAVVHNHETGECRLASVDRRDVPYDLIDLEGFRMHERLVDC